jgi:predicted 3-demethylubiquinone-9 3-methyltransferase (glyoxalase superfamily)
MRFSKITPCLWFDRQAEDAVRFYTSIFKNSRIVTTTRYGEAGHEIHHMPAGTVMTVSFEIEGQSFTR